MVALPKTLVHDTEKLAERVVELGDADGVEAVVTVLRDHVRRLDRQRRSDALRAVADEFQASLVNRSTSSKDAQDELYDELGLPR